MKIKTSELIGRPLDWAVATLSGYSNLRMGVGAFANTLVMDPPRKEYGAIEFSCLCYSTDWAQGGPIIQQRKIQWAELNGGIEAWSGWDFLTWLRDWEGDHKMPDGAGFGRHETDVLIAAMRCFVGSKLGDEVDVPEELCS